MSMYLVHWSAKVSFRKNAIIGDVDRVKKTTSNFQLEKARIMVFETTISISTINYDTKIVSR